MTTFTQTKLDIWAAEMHGESTLPTLYDCKTKLTPWATKLNEDDGLFVGYGRLASIFPYRSQDCYTRELENFGLDAVVLENDHLKASFIPSQGGKLWSLYDKDAGKELLFSNHVFRPAYLALRNAWASGGIEWNCGAYIGHHPHTCAPMFTAIIDKENSGLGCPVLRFYTYERIRSITQQMDFYLPEGAKFLHCRMRVVNDNPEVVPIYWWSNIAVTTDEKARCVVPADASYSYIDDHLTTIPVPHYEGTDVSYPVNTRISRDYFFKTNDQGRHYTSHLDANGYGLVETSTSRLKGRKLFVWGQGQGGTKWQEYLCGDDGHGTYGNGKYCEIQCGLAHSQFECLPMPPETAWEWIEYYGAVTADPVKIHGEWHEAQAELEKCLDNLAPLDAMEAELNETRKMSLTPADRMIEEGYGWGALEILRRAKKNEKPMSPHLNFGVCGKEQEMWLQLLTTGSLRTSDNGCPSEAPISYQRRPEWIAMLEEAAKGPDQYFWLTHYMLGCAYIAENVLDKAAVALDASARLNTNAWNTYAIAELYRLQGKPVLSARTMAAAARMIPDDASLCKMAAKSLLKAKLHEELRVFIEELSDEMKQIPRIRLARAISAVSCGNVVLAEQLLNENGGLEIPDIQEGELSITELWFQIEEKKAELEGRVFDRTAVRPPMKFDFRMNVAD